MGQTPVKNTITSPPEYQPRWLECQLARLQSWLPHLWLSHLFGKLANRKADALTQWLIRRFVNRYGVDLFEAAQPDIEHYSSFNDFFTRALREGVRPVAGQALVSPVDGTVSQLGEIENNQIFQAKGHRYSIQALLGGHNSASSFQNGQFITIYLSPRDYHRVHMPCDGRLISMTHIPGSLYSVNPATAGLIPGLFARNERVVCLFESSELGRFALVLVGATIVGSMATTWHGVLERTPGILHHDYQESAPEFKKGDEMGRFQLGSTVVLLFEPNKIEFLTNWHAGKTVQYGQAMGNKC